MVNCDQIDLEEGVVLCCVVSCCDDEVNGGARLTRVVRKVRIILFDSLLVFGPVSPDLHLCILFVVLSESLSKVWILYLHVSNESLSRLVEVDRS